MVPCIWFSMDRYRTYHIMATFQLDFDYRPSVCWAVEQERRAS